MAAALVLGMKLRDSNIELDETLEDFMTNIQPTITKDNCSEILRRAERTSSEVTDSCPSNEDEDRSDEDNSDNDETILATLSDATDDDEDENDGENELDTSARGKGRQVMATPSMVSLGPNRLRLLRERRSGETAMVKVVSISRAKRSMA